jgi:3-carboxy-cis,cis-muconate cycloisomerase
LSASAFDNPLLSGLLGDEELAPFFSAEAELSEVLAFEQALLIAEEEEEVIPAGTVKAVLPAMKAFRPDVAKIREGAARDGVIGVELVRQLRQAVGEPNGQFVHFGATSQDVVDTALTRRLRPVLSILERRLGTLTTALLDLDKRFGAAPLIGRTRMQDALPTTVGDRLAAWRGPLERDLDRLAALRPRLLVLQFGGAVGTLDRLGDKGPAVARRLAAALELGLPSGAWHSQRDNIVELAGWLALVTGSLGKIGADVGLMAQNSVGEIVLAGSGGSSAMPHKSNPVGAEVLVALAHANAALLGGMNHAMVHEQERSGAAWTLEWLLLPQMLMATGASLRTAINLLGQVTRMGRPG